MPEHEPIGLCPHCGGPAEQSQRYPRALCPDCSARTTDLAGRAVSKTNVSLSGGFVATHVNDGTPCAQVTQDGRVLIDGIEFRAGEHRFGGTVVQPLD